jgi:tetrathionate reductase subunit B
MSFEMRLDISRCIGCRACEVACVTANDLPPEHSRNWVPHLEASRAARAHATFAPYLCSHCEEPPCVPACPTGASYQADDGRVLVDRELCIGCGMCVPACPYDARHVEPESNRLEKCTLCEGRVRSGRPPACFEVCPAGARHVVEDGAPAAAVGDPARPDPGTRVERLVTAAVDPRPRLTFSGRPEDLALLRARRPPREGAHVPGALWRNGAGWLVQGLGLAAAAAMAGMVGLRVIRGRLARQQAPAAPAASPAPPPAGGAEADDAIATTHEEERP